MRSPVTLAQIKNSAPTPPLSNLRKLAFLANAVPDKTGGELVPVGKRRKPGGLIVVRIVALRTPFRRETHRGRYAVRVKIPFTRYLRERTNAVTAGGDRQIFDHPTGRTDVLFEPIARRRSACRSRRHRTQDSQRTAPPADGGSVCRVHVLPVEPRSLRGGGRTRDTRRRPLPLLAGRNNSSRREPSYLPDSLTPWKGPRRYPCRLAAGVRFWTCPRSSGCVRMRYRRSSCVVRRS